MEEILKKARRFVPFMNAHSKVEYGGDHVPLKESYIDTYSWQNGWWEEGVLFLSSDGEIVGKVIHIYSSGVCGVESHETEEDHPQGEACYLLYYNVKSGTENEEWATLYRISK